MKYFFYISFILIFGLAIIACTEKQEQETEEPAGDETKIEQPATDAPDKTGEETDADVPQEDERIEQPEDEEEAKETTDTETQKGEAKKETSKAASGMMEGYAISMNDLVTSDPKKLSKTKAMDLVSKGQMILFYSNNKAYFVYHADGSFAGRRLAKMADAKAIKIKGDHRNKDGLRIIIAEDMEMVK